jgi:hypothetical protein
MKDDFFGIRLSDYIWEAYRAKSDKKSRYTPLPNDFLMRPEFEGLAATEKLMLITFIAKSNMIGAQEQHVSSTTVARLLQSRADVVQRGAERLQQKQLLTIFSVPSMEPNKVNKELINKAISMGQQSAASPLPCLAHPFIGVEKNNGETFAEKIFNLWRTKTKNSALKNVRELSKSRIDQINKTKKAYPDLLDWERGIDNLLQSKFCLGQNERNWKATFDWFIKPESKESPCTLTKILEDKYENSIVENSKKSITDFFAQLVKDSEAV